MSNIYKIRSNKNEKDVSLTKTLISLFWTTVLLIIILGKMMFDDKYLSDKYEYLAGVDEVGRGCLAGPVVSACVKLNYGCPGEARCFLKSLKQRNISDSKILTSIKRKKIVEGFGFFASQIELNQKLELLTYKNCMLSVAVAEISNTLVDKINILNASMMSMGNAFNILNSEGEKGILLVDGNFCPKIDNVEMIPVVKGDTKSLLIGLASIFAKEYRDNLMCGMDQRYPGYNFRKNVGYGTKEHLEQIKSRGSCDIHRRSFRGVV